MNFEPNATRRPAAAVFILILVLTALVVVLRSRYGIERVVVSGQGGPTSSDIADIRKCLTELSSYSVFVRDSSNDVLLPEDLDIGVFAQLNILSEEFYSLEAQGNLLDEVIPSDKWIAPLVDESDVKGAVVVMMDDSDNSYYCDSLLESEMGEALGEIHAGDAVLWEPATDAHLLLREGTVTPLDHRAETIVSGPTSLEAFQTSLHAYFE